MEQPRPESTYRERLQTMVVSQMFRKCSDVSSRVGRPGKSEDQMSKHYCYYYYYIGGHDESRDHGATSCCLIQEQGDIGAFDQSKSHLGAPVEAR